MKKTLSAIGLLLASPAFAYNESTAIPKVYAAPSTWPTDPRFGAKCDNIADDSAAFTAALGKYNVLFGSTLQNCQVKNLVISDRQTLDCQGAVLQAAPGAQWIVKKTGFASFIRNCIVFDPNLYEMQSSTLSIAAAPGTTILNVVSAASFQVNMVATVKLASGAYWPSRITAVDTGANTITIANAIPSTVTGVSLATGGTGYADLTEAVLSGGVGAPATVNLTATAGAITGATVDAPGLYQTAPAAVVAPFQPARPAAFSGTLNVTYGGALIGANVDAAFGAIIDDNANGGAIENVTVSEAPGGLQVLASAAGVTTQESILNFDVNAAPLFGMAKFSGVNNITMHNGILQGFAHNASAYGAVGLYIEGNNRAFANGGNTFGVFALGFENGTIDVNGQLDIFDKSIMDTNRNNGMVCIGCSDTDFTYLFASFTGPNAIPSLGSSAKRGVGAYYGSSPLSAALNNSITKLTASNNATDLHLGDAVSSVTLGPASISPSKALTASPGAMASLFPVNPIMSIGTSASIGGQTPPLYFTPRTFSTTQTIGYTAAHAGEITSMFASSSIAPGADTYSAVLQINKWGGAAYLGWNNVATCTWTGTGVACTWASSGIPITQNDQIDISISTTGASFVANQTINAFVGGI